MNTRTKDACPSQNFALASRQSDINESSNESAQRGVFNYPVFVSGHVIFCYSKRILFVMSHRGVVGKKKYVLLRGKQIV